MAGAARAASRVQNRRQGRQQKAAAGRGCRDRVGSNQPKPRAGRAQTAQGGSGVRIADHAACPSGAGCAPKTSCRMAYRLNLKVSSAEAW